MVGLNRSVGPQPYSLDDEHNTMVGLNRSVGSQPYSLDDKHNNMVGLNRSMSHIVVLVIKVDPIDLFNPTILLCLSSRE
jgi:hypothetical protein